MTQSSQRLASDCHVLLAAIFISLFMVTAADAQWGPDIKLSTDATLATLNENMGQCLIAEGNKVHVVWAESKNNDHAIYYKRSTDKGATWGPDTRISPTPGADSFPLLAQAGDTLHLVFFRNGRTPQAASYYKRSLDGGLTWEPDVLLGETMFWPGLAAAGSSVYVSLNEVYPDDAKNSVVYFRRSTDNGATWAPKQQISQAPRRMGGRSEDPAIVADGKYVHLVWNDNRDAAPGKGMSVGYRRSADGGVTWEPVQMLTQAPAYTYFPTIHVTGPHAEIAYGDRQTGTYQILRLHSADHGTTWDTTAPVTASADGGFYPAILRDGSNVHLAWSTKTGIKYLHSGDGGANWDPISDLAGDGRMAFLAVAGEALHVVFVSKRDGSTAIYYKQNPTGNKSVR